MILQSENTTIFRLFLSTSKNEAKTFNLDFENKKVIAKNTVQMNNKILEIYKNKYYPYNYTILTNDNLLTFYTNSLEF